MSLQVWLPLNGNLDNQGLSAVTIDGTAAYLSGGKIDKCLTTSNTITVTASSMANKKIWSFAFWGYVKSYSVTTNWTAVAHLHDGSSNLRLEVCPKTYSSGQYCYSVHNNSGYAITTGAIASPTNGYYDKWAHVCLTSDGTTITKYIDGVSVGTCTYNGTGSFNGTFSLRNNNIIQKCDVRLYDNCLSAKEVKEISKSLILHYKLSDLDSFDRNVEYDCSGYCNNGEIQGTITKDTSTMRYARSYKLTTGLDYIKSSLTGIYNTLTISFWVKPSSSNGGYSIACCDYGAPSGGLWLATNCESSAVWAYYHGAYAAVSGTLSNDTWHHCAFVLNDFDSENIVKWYVDGALKTMSKNTWMAPEVGLTNLTIGNSYTGTSWNTKRYGNMSDFRVYTTALSAADILELYNTAASVDDQGNGYCYEFTETTETNVTQQGLFKTKGLVGHMRQPSGSVLLPKITSGAVVADTYTTVSTKPMSQTYSTGLTVFNDIYEI